MVKKYLKDYVNDGRYTIVIDLRSKSLMHRIKELYPTACITTSNADGIGGEKLLVDKWAADGLGLKAALRRYKDEDVVYENFSKEFVERPVFNTTGNERAKRDTIDWLNDCIELLSNYRDQAATGDVIITYGSCDMCSPLPSIDQTAEKNVSISFDYIGIDKVRRE